MYGRRPRVISQSAYRIIQDIRDRNDRIKSTDRYLNLRDPEPLTPSKYAGKPIKPLSDQAFDLVMSRSEAS